MDVKKCDRANCGAIMGWLEAHTVIDGCGTNGKSRDLCAVCYSQFKRFMQGEGLFLPPLTNQEGKTDAQAN